MDLPREKRTSRYHPLDNIIGDISKGVTTQHSLKDACNNMAFVSLIEQWKLLRISNGNNFSHECPIQAYNISIRSKLNLGNSREIQMVITFHSEVRFRRIIDQDVQN